VQAPSGAHEKGERPQGESLLPEAVEVSWLPAWRTGCRFGIRVYR